MSIFIHILLTFGRHLWRAVASFWLASVTASLWALYRAEDYPDVALTVLEIVTWFWFTVRLMQSESFQTHGGWRVRPVTAINMTACRYTCYAIVVLPMLVLRTVCLCKLLQWNFTQWVRIEAVSFLILVVFTSMAAGIISWRAKQEGTERGWIKQASQAGALIALMIFGYYVAKVPGINGSNGGSGISTPPPGLQAFVPPGDEIIQQYGAGGSVDSPKGLRIIARISARVGATVTQEGIAIRINEVEPSGNRLKYNLTAFGPASLFKSWGKHVFVVIRYSNGMWGWQRRDNRRWYTLHLPGFSVMHWNESGEILSPMLHPWITESWAELLKGAELLVLVPDATVPVPTVAKRPREPGNSGQREQTIPLPELPETPSASQIAALTQAIVAQFQIDPWSEASNKAHQRLDQLGSAAVPVVLECTPFTARAWDSHLRRYLMKHATADHLPTLTKMLDQDPRIAEVMIHHGWQADAMPALLRHLAARVTLGELAFTSLADLKDPTLAADLCALSLRDGMPFDLVRKLKDHPGVDWLELVREGCQRSASLYGSPSYGWLEHAAPLGDQSLFAEQAALWCRNPKSPDKATIQAWIAKEAWDGNPTEFPAWLRENFPTLRWNSTHQRWTR